MSGKGEREKKKKKQSPCNAVAGHPLHPLLKNLPLGAGAGEDQGKDAATSRTRTLGWVALWSPLWGWPPPAPTSWCSALAYVLLFCFCLFVLRCVIVFTRNLESLLACVALPSGG